MLATPQSYFLGAMTCYLLRRVGILGAWLFWIPKSLRRRVLCCIIGNWGALERERRIGLGCFRVCVVKSISFWICLLTLANLSLLGSVFEMRFLIFTDSNVALFEWPLTSRQSRGMLR